MSTRGRVGAEAIATSKVQRLDARLRAFAAYFLVIALGVGLALLDMTRPDQLYVGFGLALLCGLLLTWIWAPVLALALTVACALVGDIVTVWWFPFNKNLSSAESILYIGDALVISPLEIVLGWALLITGYRNLAQTGRPFRSAPLLVPLLVFGVFTFGGLVVGLGSGGDVRIAMFEARPVLYLPFFYLLAINVCSTLRDYTLVLATAVAGIFVQSLLSLDFLFDLDRATRANLESLIEHGSAISMNLVFVAFIVALAYEGVPKLWRVSLGVIAAPMLYVYVVSERRAAIVSLLVALVLVSMLLFWRQRRTFWRVVPIVVVVLVGYVGAFWNSQSSAGFPAQAIKSAVVSEDLNEADASSNAYREAENYNLVYTIRSSPVTGVGFGQPFLRPIPLADISFFQFYEYIPHNSLLWIWIKTGIGGFLAMLYVFARALALGTARARAAPPGVPALVTSVSLAFVLMFALYLFVDIAWEPRNVVLLAVAMAVCTARIDGLGAPPPTPAVASIDRDADERPHLAVVRSSHRRAGSSHDAGVAN